MRLYYIVSGILILSITGLAVAAPVPGQQKHQPGAHVVHIPEDAITVLGKRGDEWKVLHKLRILSLFGKPEDSEATHSSSSEPADRVTDVNQPSPSNTASEESLLVSSTASSTKSQYESMDWEPSGPASSTMFSENENHELMGAHSLPNPGPSLGSDVEMVDVLPPPIESGVKTVDMPASLGSAPPIGLDRDKGVPPSMSSTNPGRLSIAGGPLPVGSAPIGPDPEMVDVPPSNPVDPQSTMGGGRKKTRPKNIIIEYTENRK